MPREQPNETTMLQTGFITSALLILAATILWSGFLIAASHGGSSEKKMNGGELMAAVITLGNAAIFYAWGMSGLRKCRKAQQAILAKKGCPEV